METSGVLRRNPWMLAFLMTFLAACVHGAPDRRVAGTGGGAPMVDEAEYARSLPPPPIIVAFDVDDTSLFSTPAFLYAKGRLVPEPPSATGSAEVQVRAWARWEETFLKNRDALFEKLVVSDGTGLSTHERGQREQLWRDVNTEGDAYSHPKDIARSLVRRHLARGDAVIFVTARSDAGGAALELKLRDDFGSERVRLQFTANRPKSDVLRQLGATIYYGDADGDMRDAVAAGARGVRVLRSKYSSNRTPTHPGERGEWYVLRASQD